MNIIVGLFGEIDGGTHHGKMGQTLHLIMSPEEAAVYKREMVAAYKNNIPQSSKVARVLIDALRAMAEQAETPTLAMPVNEVSVDAFNRLIGKK